ncbi:MAG: aromatic ring-opening dioxygenase LigA [Acidimicrobiia bacterium]|nr:aromatic ring-opening dioxygenase LigA [Acidimicrobiia bacterium]
MRKAAYISTLVVGIVFILAGITTWVIVSNTLADQRIVVSDDAPCLAGDEVNGPFSAYCQALIINEHTLHATGGKTYAELPQDDPLRATAMQSAFLQSSLYTSVVAFGVAGMGVVLGLLFILISFGMRDVASIADGPEQDE